MTSQVSNFWKEKTYGAITHSSKENSWGKDWRRQGRMGELGKIEKGGGQYRGVIMKKRGVGTLYQLWRVWFNDLLFVIHDPSWTFHKSYFSGKHISRIIWWAEYNMVLKPAHKYQIIWQFDNFKNILIDDFEHD